VLLDIDHSPRQILHRATRATPPTGWRLHQLHPTVFALWSNDPPDEEIVGTLGEVFAAPEAHVVRFPNPLQERESANTVYVARR
jgi:hypothetical protein